MVNLKSFTYISPPHPLNDYMMQTNFIITVSKIYTRTSQNVQDFNIWGTRVRKQKQLSGILVILSIKHLPWKRILQTIGKLLVDLFGWIFIVLF